MRSRRATSRPRRSSTSLRRTASSTRSGRSTGPDRDALVAAFARIPALYIADGHHRAASAARARTEMLNKGIAPAPLGDGADFNAVLAVAFPHDQVQILPYNRVVKDLGGLTRRRVSGARRRGLRGHARIRRPRRSAARSSMYFGGSGGRFVHARARLVGSDRFARCQRAAGAAAHADPRNRRHPHRQADRFRRRRPRHGGARAAGHRRDRRLSPSRCFRSASPT